MSNILALDTSTDACSVALRVAGRVDGDCQLLPRQHNHRLFSMLRERLAALELGLEVFDVLAYAQGPGSFTGLRIAASAVQGLAYSLDRPVVGVSTLACLAQGALRRGQVSADDTLLVMLDARINEIYWGVYRFEEGLASAVVEDAVTAPAELPDALPAEYGHMVALGSGLCHFDALPAALRECVVRRLEDQWPDSLDLLPLVDAALDAGKVLSARDVQPVYLRNEIHWKKLAEQG